MNILLYWVGYILLLVFIGFYMLKYLNGGFNYKEEIIQKGNIVNHKGRNIGTYYVIKRTYDNGKIVIRTIESI